MTFTNSNDTIVAIATARGIGSIAIVRLSGKDALNIAQLLTKSSLKPRRASLKRLYDNDDSIIDRAVVIYFAAPKSFTTEDVVEFQTHGGEVVASIVLSRLLELGARLANPGEFSKRAYLGGRVDLLELETAAALIEAKSQEAAKLLAKQIDSGLKVELEGYKNALLEVLALVEVNIDYAEEELPPDYLSTIKTNLADIEDRLIGIINATNARSSMFEGYKLSIIGKPNVGKSSLLNRLLMYERAIVSDTAGTTRDTIEESVKIGTHLVRIVDTAGIREGVEEIERIGIGRSFESAKESKVILALFDRSAPLQDEDISVLEFLKTLENKKIFILLTKSDLPEKIDKRVFENLDFETVEISIQNPLNTLNGAILNYLDKNATYEESLLTSKRQIESAKNGINALQRAKELLSEGELELFAFEIKEALNAIASINMPTSNDELLDKIFSSFCLGK